MAEHESCIGKTSNGFTPKPCKREREDNVS